MTATATQPVSPEKLAAARKAVISSSIGAALEWFDVIIYASFATIIAKQFFTFGPDTPEVVGLILTFATFAVTYLIRPIGGMVLGSYADRGGRKNALTLTMMLMMVGTLILAVTPDYATIGVAAPLLILFSRLVQGFSAGGEFGTATTFLVETAPHRKNFYASWQIVSQGASMFMASFFGYALNTWMAPEVLNSWGWRIPFFFGLIVGPVGLYIRAKLDETDEFVKLEKEHSPLKTLLVNHYGRLLAGAAVIGVATITTYLILYMPTFAVTNLHIPPTAAFLGGVVAGVINMVAVPYIGALADKVGPARIMTWAALAALIGAWPLFAVIVANPTVPMLVLVIAILGTIMAFYFGPLPGLMSSLFPAAIRGSGLSVAYNVGVTLLGGIAPLVLTWLISTTGSLTVPSVYYIVISVISLVGLYFVRAKYQQA